MDTLKVAKRFKCEKCNFECSNKYDYNKHLGTAKHNKIHEKTQSYTSALFVINNISFTRVYGSIDNPVKNNISFSQTIQLIYQTIMK